MRLLMLCLDEIKLHYLTDGFFKLSFESWSKEARTTNEIGKFDFFKCKMRFYIIMIEFVFPSLVNTYSTL